MNRPIVPPTPPHRTYRLVNAAAMAARLPIALIFLIAATMLSGSWNADFLLGWAEAAQSEKSSFKLNIVSAEQIETRDFIVGTGTIAPAKTSDIGALVEGQVTEVYVRVGDRLEQDAPLFQIRPHTYRFRVDEAKAHLAMAKARAAEAQSSFHRAKELHKANTVSAAALDKALSAIGVANAEVHVAKARLENAKQNLNDTTVRAPYKSVVTARRADEGVYLSTRLSGGTGQTVLQLQKIDIVVAIIRVSARALERVRVNSEVRLEIDGISRSVKAMVTVVNDKIDVATRTIEVRVAMPNEDYAIKPGLFVRAEILPKARMAIVIPRNVVMGDASNAYVFALHRGKAVRRNVRIVQYDATRVEVTTGLEAGDRILSGPDLHGVVDGQQIGELSDVAG